MKPHFSFAILLISTLASLAATTFAQTYTYETVNYPEATSTIPVDINNNGVIVGSFSLSDDTPDRFPFVVEGRAIAP